jgi:hypothetical protein
MRSPEQVLLITHMFSSFSDSSVLHNPHLGLSKTLHHLYELTKTMADCVVPQEYGTTIEEKRSVGVKICHGLLEKIKYDLNIARTDNDVDMRYGILSPIELVARNAGFRSSLFFAIQSLALLTLNQSFRSQQVPHQHGVL